MKDFLKEACENLDIYITEHMVNQLFSYKDMLIEHNKNINLTAITDEKDIILKHFVDSLVGSKHIKNFFLKEPCVIDIGTGAGFPGIPLAIALPDVNFTLLDSLAKRTDFLELVCNKLGLSNVKIVTARTEDAAHELDYREKYDFCVSRGVAPLYKLLELGIGFVKPFGSFLAYKGAKAFEEIEEAKESLNIFGCSVSKIYKYTLPTTDISPNLIFVDKKVQTPLIYPRKPNKIKNNPLK